MPDQPPSRPLPLLVRWGLPLIAALLVAGVISLSARARLAAEHTAALNAGQSAALDAGQRSGAAIEQALRQRMAANDLDDMAAILTPVELPSGARVQVIGPQDHVYLDSAGRSQDDLLGKDLPSCAACHDQAELPQAVWLPEAPQVMRVATPIQNEPRCASCHASSQPNFGVVLVDVSVADQFAAADQARQSGWALSLALAGGAALLVGGLLWWGLGRVRRR